MAGVALGFLGLPALIKSPTARPVPTETVYVTVTPTAPAASGPGPSAPGPGASTSPPPDGVTTLTLPRDYGFRLRETAPVIERRSGALDFFRDSSTVWTANGARIVALEPQEPGTLDTCRTVTRFVEKVRIEALQTGTRFCFETGKGALALVEVPKDGDAATFVVLNVTLLGAR
ncbi:hypothetical protein ACFRJ1_06560 [Streptomyces sp. NPDC056773]|uniref:hypothetical protein n=1 Tax=unclassified Streptomyces TaxID=2593676 RepID=UPI0036C04372